MNKIAYIAPELTALSETFVYAELRTVEAAGFDVVPFCVHRPRHPAHEAQAIAERTTVLYSGWALRRVVAGAFAAASFGTGGLGALRMLLADMVTAGTLHLDSWKLLYQWLAAARMGRILQQQRCTHIHAHFVNTPTQIAMYASAFTGIPFTATAHANDIFAKPFLLREKAARARTLLTISEFNKRYLVAMGIPHSSIDVLRCTPDFAVADSTEAPPTGPPFVVGTLCRLVEKKGVDDLIRAVAADCAAGTDVMLEIAGVGPERGALEALVNSLELSSRVRFLGALDHRDVAGWMRGLHLFVMACKTDQHGDIDGIPVALMEAMALGVPVVATRISGIPELVIDGRTGLLAEPARPDELALKIRQALESGSGRMKLAQAARTWQRSSDARSIRAWWRTSARRWMRSHETAAQRFPFPCVVEPGCLVRVCPIAY